MKLPKEFYLEDKVERLAPLFLDKYLMTKIDGKITGGRIVEVEAYAGKDVNLPWRFATESKFVGYRSQLS